MSMIEIDENHDPETAVFWARFATEIGEQQRHCPTVTLYQNLQGEFFAIEESPKVPATRAELIKKPLEWLQEQVKWLNGRMAGS